MAAVAASKPPNAAASHGKSSTDAFITSLRSEIQIIQQDIERCKADIANLSSSLTSIMSAADHKGVIGMSEVDKQLILITRQEIVAKENQIAGARNQIAAKEQQIVEEQRKQNLEAERELFLSTTFE